MKCQCQKIISFIGFQNNIFPNLIPSNINDFPWQLDQFRQSAPLLAFIEPEVLNLAIQFGQPIQYITSFFETHSLN